MTAERSVCRLCYDTVKENDGDVITEDLREILQTVLTKIDLTISAKPVICNTCREKLEANYIFKRKCIFTEDSITPFVSKNVKLDLKEVRNQIIKSEDIENDKNICRLCLQFVDNDMTLSNCEKEQFQQFFPEIDLSRTNFVIMCSTCYDLLHKYFIFVTSCLNLEQRLHNHSLDQTENKIDIIEEHVGVKLENFKQLIKKEGDKKEVTLNEEDEKLTLNEDEKLALNEELDIKCDTEEEDDERCDTNNPDIEQLMKKEESDSDIFSDESISDQEEMNNSKTSEKPNSHRCKRCCRNFKHKGSLKYHTLTVHTDPSKITLYSCEQCDKIFKHHHVLKRHVLNLHTDPSKIYWYRCERCDKKFKYSHVLKSHILDAHTDSSKITWYQCQQCDKQFKHNHILKRHVREVHIDPSKVICDHCNKKFKSKSDTKRHVLVIHTDPSKMTWYRCEQCDKKFKHNYILKKHILYVHTDLSKITWYQCKQCDKKYKSKEKLKKHSRNIHKNSSKIEKIKQLH